MKEYSSCTGQCPLRLDIGDSLGEAMVVISAWLMIHLIGLEFIRNV